MHWACAEKKTHQVYWEKDGEAKAPSQEERKEIKGKQRRRLWMW